MMNVQVEDDGKSESLAVMAWIDVFDVMSCESIAHFHRVVDHKKLVIRTLFRKANELFV
jgi:hypothetical protein